MSSHANNPLQRIIDRYMSDASPDEKAEALKRLDGYVKLLFQIALSAVEREMREEEVTANARKFDSLRVSPTGNLRM
jgi:hypothetical protein